jgi:hypothetical protein
VTRRGRFTDDTGAPYGNQVCLGCGIAIDVGLDYCDGCLTSAPSEIEEQRAELLGLEESS